MKKKNFLKKVESIAQGFMLLSFLFLLTNFFLKEQVVRYSIVFSLFYFSVFALFLVKTAKKDYLDNVLS